MGARVWKRAEDGAGETLVKGPVSSVKPEPSKLGHTHASNKNGAHGTHQHPPKPLSSQPHLKPPGSLHGPAPASAGVKAKCPCPTPHHHHPTSSAAPQRDSASLHINKRQRVEQFQNHTRNGIQPPAASTVSTDAALKAKEQAMRELAAKIAEEERRLDEARKQAALEAKQNILRKQQQQQEELRMRQARLNSGFAPAFSKAQQAQASRAKAAAAIIADEAEVQRVLRAPDDYACLMLTVGVGAAVIKSRFRELAVQLHPDKCKVDGATEAFQRVHKAYQSLLKYVV